MTADAWQAAATTTRHAHEHLAHRPTPYPRRDPAPDQPTDAQLVAFARQVLAWHRPVPRDDGGDPHWCTCGAHLVLCAYRGAATRYLGPPTTPPPVGA